MKRGEIWDVELPLPPGGTGREQTGFRPGIVINMEPDPGNSMCATVLLSSKLSAMRFPHTLLINPSLSNGLAKPSVALVHQITAIDRRRFVRKRGELEPSTLAQLDDEIKKLLDLK